MMTFWQHLLATFIGSVAGFVFGLMLHHYSERSKTKTKHKQLLAGLVKEFELNFLLIDGWINQTESLLRRISAGDQQISQSYRFTDFQRMFLQMCFQEGILYNRLSSKNLAYLNGILLHFDNQPTQALNNLIAQWNSSQVPKLLTSQMFELELRTLKEFKDELEQILEQIK